MTTTVDGIIGVVTTGNVTANNFFGNISGNTISGDINTTGNITASANISGYNVEAANQVYIGPLQLRAINANTFGVFKTDGVTQANIDVGNVDASQITQGTSKIAFDAVNGNAYTVINGSNVMKVTQTGAFISSEAPTGLTITSAASESSVSRIIAKSSRGTLAVPAPIAQNDQIVSLTGYAYTSFGNYQQTGGFGITANGPAVPNGTSLVNSISPNNYLHNAKT